MKLIFLKTREEKWDKKYACPYKLVLQHCDLNYAP